MTPTPNLLDISDLRVDFASGRQLVPALHGISLSVAPGEALGIVGESGCGKSITWLAALRLLDGNARISGQVRLGGRDLLSMPERELDQIRGGRIAMIFQDPSNALNPLHSIGRQLLETLALHRGLKGAAARREAMALLDQVGIANAERRMASYPHELSGGMNQRVMIAIALAGEPDLLIADEPTTALDVTIQAQILDLLQEIRRARGMAMVLISHDLGLVAEMTERVVVMYAGRVIEESPAERLFRDPAHPYTRGLIAALPDLDGPKRPLIAIPGTVPPPHQLPKGCSFGPRCAHAFRSCDQEMPALRALAQKVAARRAACHMLERPAPSQIAPSLSQVLEARA